MQSAIRLCVGRRLDSEAAFVQSMPGVSDTRAGARPVSSHTGAHCCAVMKRN